MLIFLENVLRIEPILGLFANANPYIIKGSIPNMNGSFAPSLLLIFSNERVLPALTGV